MMKSVSVDSLPRDYRAARAAFLEAADARSLGTTTRVHPSATSRDGRFLFMDSVAIGRRGAEKALLVISGTGGVDGYFGSAVQTALLRAAPEVPPDVRLVLVHALNPYGFARARSVNEENVRIDRNFVDFSQLPDNPHYAALAAALTLNDMAPETLAAADAVLDDFTARHGEEALQQLLLGGQYAHPDGLFYGGTEPSWSRKMLADVFREELRGSDSVVTLDLRTGFGPFGRTVLISDNAPGTAEDRLARKIWQGAHLEYACDGPLQNFASCRHGGMGRFVAGLRRHGLFMTLMAGTRPFGDILRTLRKDNWCARQGLDNDASARISDEVRAMYCPDARGWISVAGQAACLAVMTALAAMSDAK